MRAGGHLDQLTELFAIPFVESASEHFNARPHNADGQTIDAIPAVYGQGDDSVFDIDGWNFSDEQSGCCHSLRPSPSAPKAIAPEICPHHELYLVNSGFRTVILRCAEC